ncbi:MAG: BLUF domain-containing protein [Rhodoferax sp.]|nr:BLUF domain-containing protein [Rhodoferax sp.]
MLASLLYVSRAVGPQTTAITSSVLTTARALNAAHDIADVLFQGQGMYLQLLDGERSVLNACMPASWPTNAIATQRSCFSMKLPLAASENGRWPTSCSRIWTRWCR